MAAIASAETVTVTPKEDPAAVFSNPDMGWVLYENYPLDQEANGSSTMATLPEVERVMKGGTARVAR